eukprot:PhF_6_TR25458/c1_g1_i8/m.35267
MSKDLQVCPCTHPHPTGGICPYSPELCSSCGAPLPHAEPTWCESTGETHEDMYPPAPTFDMELLKGVPRPTSVEEAIKMITKDALLYQPLSFPCFYAKVREIIQKKDVIELARVSSWAKAIYQGYCTEGVEIVTAMDDAEVFMKILGTYFYIYIHICITNQSENILARIVTENKAYIPNIVTVARDTGCVDLLRSLAKKGVIDPSEVPTWPPSMDV